MLMGIYDEIKCIILMEEIVLEDLLATNEVYINKTTKKSLLQSGITSCAQ
jgi:hypothetical protein